MIEVYPKKIDVKAAQFELQRLVDAFLGVAEAKMSEKDEGQSAPAHEPPLSPPLTLSSKTR
jgi:hypothetical protein